MPDQLQPPPLDARKKLTPIMGFFDFVRERGVAGFAVGFILGGAVTKMVSSFVADIINPALGLFIGSTASLAEITVGPMRVGAFAAATIDFLVLALIVYFIFKQLGLDRLDKPKQ